MQAPSTPKARKAHEAIRKWVVWLMQNNCFCPREYDRPFDSDTNVQCYISSPGTVEGCVNESADVKRILRYNSTERGANSAVYMVGTLIMNGFGQELTRYCHFGSEPSIITRTVEKLQAMIVDLRAVMQGSPIYDTKKHMEKLGLQGEMPGLCRQPVTGGGADNFLKLPVVWKSASGGTGSEGAGVNMWALLTGASLLGCNHIHCKASSRVAQSVLTLILKNAPAAMTPGNYVPVRSFHEQTREAEAVVVSGEGRPEHFVRPIDDDLFANTGVFSYCAVENGDMPEDFLGFPAREQAKFLNCRYVDVPASHVFGSYQLMPGRYYCVYGKKEAGDQPLVGSLMVGKTGVVVEMSDGTIVEWGFVEWQAELKKMGLLVLPSIWRSGAVVLLKDGKQFGCLVSDGTRESMRQNGYVPRQGEFVSNFDHIGYCYHALLDRHGAMSVIPAFEVLDALVSPGTFVWIKGGTDAWESLKEFLPATEMDLEEAEQRCIRARLNVPMCVAPVPGKVYVTVLMRSPDSLHAQDVSYRHLDVDPWELAPEPPDRADLQVKELVL